MRISDWSSDVCSSDLAIAVAGRRKSAISHAMNKRARKPPIAPAASATNEKGGHRKEPALVIPASSMLSFPRKRESRRRRHFSGVGGFTRAVLDSRLRGNDNETYVRQPQTKRAAPFGAALIGSEVRSA